MNRKDFLKSLGALTAGATFLGTGETVKAAGKAMGVSVDNSLFTDPEVDFPVKGLKAGVKNGPVKVIIIGAGNRGRTYANYAKMFPDCMQIVGVSDIRESRKNAMGDRFNVPEEHRSAIGAKCSEYRNSLTQWLFPHRMMFTMTLV